MKGTYTTTEDIFTATGYNQRGQVTGYTLGNGLSTTRGYDDFGFPTTIQTPGIQDLAYQFDTQTGNLNWRKDVAKTLQEDFTYDNLMKNRLESWQVNTGTTYSVNYASNGNIDTKTELGTFSYNAPQPHAVSEIENTGNLVSGVEQIVRYTPFNKVDTIREGNYRLEITYGPDQARKITRLYNNNVLEKTKYYIGGNYEVEIDGSGNERKLHYIYGGDGLAAIFEKTSAAENLYYIHKDHLGSFTVVTDANGTMVEEMSFDPWGRKRNPTNWFYDSSMAYAYTFDRGFTGHEHLDEFNLINMNGRVYDPILGRFLSPDNYIQLPDYTQSLNRYSYCLNNPLIYTDPSGDFLFHLFAAWAGNYLTGVVDNWINKEMPLGEAFKATPVVAGTNFTPGNITRQNNFGFSNPQVDAHNIANQDISVQISGFSGMDQELSGYGDFVINQQFVGESPLAGGVAQPFNEKVLNEFISYSESTIDGMVYTITGLGSSLYGGFRNMALDMKYNKGWAGYGRWFPGKHDPIYAYGFTFGNGFVPEVLDQGNLSWINGKRVINGTLGILLFPMEFANTGYRGLNIIIDQAITGGVSYGIGTGLDKIPND